MQEPSGNTGAFSSPTVYSIETRAKEKVNDMRAWYMKLLLEQPQGYEHIQKVIAVDVSACRFMKSELERENLLNQPHDLAAAAKFFHLMDMTLSEYFIRDNDQRLRRLIESVEVTVRGQAKTLDFALSLYHVVFGALAFRPIPKEAFDMEVNFYIDELRPKLWACIKQLHSFPPAENRLAAIG